MRAARRPPARPPGNSISARRSSLSAVLADSAVEHYRGSFHNRAMYVPLAAAALALGGSLHGITGPARQARHPLRDAIYALAAATGIAGLGFHAYNINKRPGGWSWLNLFYAAPIGAPFALTLSGFLGRGAEKARAVHRHRTEKTLGLPLQRLLAAVSAAGLAGTVGEAALLHFRGAYHNPAMFLPVSIPPVAATLLGAAAVAPSRRTHRLARWWLQADCPSGLRRRRPARVRGRPATWAAGATGVRTC